MQKRRRLVIIGFLICCIITAAIIPSVCHAKEEQNKTVRVAYVISPGYQEGGEGEYKTGYGYEYLQKLASINGWKYEYVYGTFPELLKKLQNGEVDLMGNLFYTKENAETISYGTYEEGKENFYLYVRKDNTLINPMDDTAINGKQIGICLNQIQEDDINIWTQNHHVDCKIIEYDTFEACKSALNDGEIDAVVVGVRQMNETISDWKVVLKMGEMPYYFGINKNRPDLLEQLNNAQHVILQKNPLYNEMIQERYLKFEYRAASSLDDVEREWLNRKESHIKFGYLKGFLPLCDQDKSGECKGVGADVLSALEQQYAEENIQFEAIAYDDYHTMFDALKSGTISAAWPAYDDNWHAEQRGYILSDPVVDAFMILVFDGKYQDTTTNKIGVINTGSLPKIYADIYYPESEVYEYDSYESAINAILTNEISSVLYVSTTYNVDITNNVILQKLNAVVVPDDFQISFAVAKQDRVLCSILDKGIAVFGEAGINQSLIINSEVEKQITIKEFLKQHPYIVAFIIAILFILIILIMYRDMSIQIKTNQAEKKIYERLSNSDPLTGLYNRKKVFQKCRELLDQHPDEQFVMAHVDMKHFRLYNTFFGNEAGDKLLCDVANLFRKMSKDYEYWAYGRSEADVFCLFFPVNDDIYQRHFKDAMKYLGEYRTDFLIEPAIGAYFVTDRKMSIEAMFTRASLAAREVQTSTPLHTIIYDVELEKELNEKQQIIADMQMAIDQEQFKVYLQPKYSLKTNQVVGAEALVRWMHPTKGIISPAKFIPVFEGNGFITVLDRYMWEHVCLILHGWKNEGKPIVPISVNVSRLSMFGISTVDFLKELVKKYDIDSKYLELELTESAYIDDPDEMKAQMLALRDAGFTILLDDFGSGYSSLNTLRELPVDILKLDMKFLSYNINDVRGQIVLASIVHMSKLLKLSLIAEGVELQEQADFLKSIDCEYVQGFLFSRPVSLEEYERQFMSDAIFTLKPKQHVDASNNEIRTETEYETEEMNTIAAVKEPQIIKTLEMQEEIWEYVKQLVSTKDINTATNSILQKVIKYYNADRAYLFEFDWEKYICSNTYEVCALNVESMIDTLQNISIDTVKLWVNLFNEKKFIQIKNINELIGDETRKEEYEILKPQGIQSLIAVPVYFEERLIGFLGVDNPKNNIDDTIFIENLAFLCVNESIRNREKMNLENESIMDPLTGAYNRKVWEQEQKILSQTGKVVCVLMIDLDNYKNINDQYGHQIGDALLKRVVDTLKKLFRVNDRIIRYGGDEFIVIVENVKAEEKRTIIKKVEKVKRILSKPLEQVPGVTLSVGIVFSNGSNGEELLKNVDSALYHAKNSGKDRWYIYEDKNRDDFS